MSGSLNRAQLIGNLGRDPEMRSKQDGSSVVTFNLATSESWKDKHTGERVEKVEWHKIVVFNERLCEFAEKFLRKGSKVFVEGQLKTRKWADNVNIDRYVTEIHLAQFNCTLTLLDSKRDTEDRAMRREPAAAGADGRSDDPLDDSVPF